MVEDVEIAHLDNESTDFTFPTCECYNITECDSMELKTTIATTTLTTIKGRVKIILSKILRALGLPCCEYTKFWIIDFYFDLGFKEIAKMTLLSFIEKPYTHSKFLSKSYHL